MSGTRCRTILYGNSLILEGVRAELSCNPGMEVITIDQFPHNLLEEMRALNPGVIIFDLAAVQPGFPLSMLQQPGLLLIGIDPVTHQALVWSGRQVAAVQASDLVSVIQDDLIQKKDSSSELSGTEPHHRK